MGAVDNVVEITIFAAVGLVEFPIRKAERLKTPSPRLGKHSGIVRGRLVLDRISDTAQPLHDFEVLGMKRAIVDQPRILVEFDCFNNQRVPFPVADSVTQIAGGNIFAMGAAISGNNAEEPAVNVVVQKNYFARILDDLLWRPNTGHSGRLALKHRVGLHLPVAQVFYLGEKLGFVLGKAARSSGWSRGGTLVVTGRRRCGRLWTIENTNGTAAQILRSDELESTVIPCSVQVRPSVRQTRRRC